jgi:hypothetical protein
MATCDSAREREANKELQNLVDTVLEEWEASGKRIPTKVDEEEDKNQSGGSGGDKGEDSMADLLAAEIAEARQKGKKGTSQNARIINTNVKGMAMVKIVPQDCCPVEIVRHVFEKVKMEKKAYSRHIVRMIPLKFCFYPDEWDLVDNVREAIRHRFPGIQLPPKIYTMTKEEKEQLKLEKQQEKERRKAERQLRRLEALAAEGAAAVSNGTSASDGDGAGVGEKRAGEDVLKEAGAAAAATGQGGEAVGESVVAAKRARIEPAPSAGIDDAGLILTPAVAAAAAENVGKKEEEVVEKEKEKEKHQEEMGGTAMAYPPFSYCVRFKGRNHNTLTRELATQYVRSNLPGEPMAVYDGENPEVSVEVFAPVLVCPALPCSVLFCSYNHSYTL